MVPRRARARRRHLLRRRTVARPASYPGRERFAARDRTRQQRPAQSRHAHASSRRAGRAGSCPCDRFKPLGARARPEIRSSRRAILRWCPQGPPARESRARADISHRLLQREFRRRMSICERRPGTACCTMRQPPRPSKAAGEKARTLALSASARARARRVSGRGATRRGRRQARISPSFITPPSFSAWVSHHQSSFRSSSVSVALPPAASSSRHARRDHHGGTVPSAAPTRMRTGTPTRLGACSSTWSSPIAPSSAARSAGSTRAAESAVDCSKRRWSRRRFPSSHGHRRDADHAGRRLHRGEPRAVPAHRVADHEQTISVDEIRRRALGVGDRCEPVDGRECRQLPLLLPVVRAVTRRATSQKPSTPKRKPRTAAPSVTLYASAESRTGIGRAVQREEHRGSHARWEGGGSGAEKVRRCRHIHHRHHSPAITMCPRGSPGGAHHRHLRDGAVVIEDRRRTTLWCGARHSPPVNRAVNVIGSASPSARAVTRSE